MIRRPSLVLFALVFAPYSWSAMSSGEIAASLEARDRAIHLLDDWIRDPYIVLAADGWYYLTGTTIESEADKTIGVPVWKSRDLVTWEKQPRLWQFSDSSWIDPAMPVKHQAGKLLLWAPELHETGGRWVVIHTTNAGLSNLLTTRGPELAGPLNEPMAAAFGRQHDPSLFVDGETCWLISACAKLTPLRRDCSAFAGPTVEVGPSDRKLGHEGCMILKIGGKYVLFGTAWSTDTMRHGTYNLYYCTSDSITGPYGPRRFAGRFLGHGTPFKDKQGRWWCTAFYNANKPTIADQFAGAELSDTAYTLNPQGTTIVPLDINIGVDGDVIVRPLDPRYARPGPEEAQKFAR